MANRLEILHRRLIEHGIKTFYDRAEIGNWNVFAGSTMGFQTIVKPYDEREFVHALAILCNGLCIALIVFVMEILCKRYGWNDYWSRIKRRMGFSSNVNF